MCFICSLNRDPYSRAASQSIISRSYPYAQLTPTLHYIDLVCINIASLTRTQICKFIGAIVSSIKQINTKSNNHNAIASTRVQYVRHAFLSWCAFQYRCIDWNSIHVLRWVQQIVKQRPHNLKLHAREYDEYIIFMKMPTHRSENAQCVSCINDRQIGGRANKGIDSCFPYIIC